MVSALNEQKPAPVARHLGLTWDHPRGFQALEAAAKNAQQRDLLKWDRQPLEGFESHPIGDLAARYDLLVLDHPHIGEAVTLDCLIALEELFPQEQIRAWARQSVGRSMDSYLWHGKHWALPLDVATQVMAYRPDLLRRSAARNWAEVESLSTCAPVALSMAGPHAFLCLLSIAAGLGEELDDHGDFLSDAVFAEAFGLLRTLYARTPKATHDLNPIELLEVMSRTDEIATIPLIYGYASYSRARPNRKQVLFADAPAAADGRRPTVLGGTGIAVTRRAKPDRQLLDHMAWLMSQEAQCRFLPIHEGQPSHCAAWLDPEVNTPVAGFYSATLETTRQAFVRPRFDGYIAFQNKAAALVRAALEAGATAARLGARLRQDWQIARVAA